jgi:hypothetical protein
MPAKRVFSFGQGFQFSPPGLRRRLQQWLEFEINTKTNGGRTMKTLIKSLLITIVALGGLGLSANVQAAPGDIHRDRRDLRSDRRDLNRDERERRTDVRELRQDRRSGDSRSDLRSDRRDIRSDSRDIRHDRGDLRSDRRDLRHDWRHR